MTSRAEPRVDPDAAEEVAGDPAGFLGLIGQYYRGEMNRATTWRQRIDRTTNWAVVITATVVTFAFSGAGNPHFILLGGLLIVAIFWSIESRRYRMYDVWRSRIRMLEENVIAEALAPRGAKHTKWRELMSEDLRQPRIKIPLREALARRLRRIYLPLLTILVLAWVARVTVVAPEGLPLAEAAGIGSVPGVLVVGGVIAFYWVVLILALWPMERRAKGELREPDEDGEEWKGD